MPAIRADLHLSESEAGLLLSAFAWSYAVAQLQAGSLLDRLGARWALAGALAIWSCVQAAAGLLGSLPQFIAARVALGLGEAPMFVGGARVCADQFDPADRVLPMGLLNASASLGPALAPLLLTPLMAFAGWLASFANLGSAGFLVAVVWSVIYRDPPKREPRLRGGAMGWGSPVPAGGTKFSTATFMTTGQSVGHGQWWRHGSGRRPTARLHRLGLDRNPGQRRSGVCQEGDTLMHRLTDGEW